MHRSGTQHFLLVGVVLAFCALAAGACGAPDEEAKPRPLPEAEEERQELRPGEYRSEEFEPPLTFKVGEGWTTDTPEAPEVLRIARTEGGALGFTNIREVYEPASSGEPVVAEPPEDLVGWFLRHPYLDTTEPKTAMVGGVEGVRFDAVLGDLPEGYRGVCLAISGSDCVDIARFSDGQELFLVEGVRVRLIVLEEVGNETVTVYLGGTATEFEGVVPEAQKVLDTVRFRGA